MEAFSNPSKTQDKTKEKLYNPVIYLLKYHLKLKTTLHKALNSSLEHRKKL